MPPGTVVHIGAGKGARKTIRETVTTTALARHRVEVRGPFGGTDGGWRPAITGTLNQSGKSDEHASTLDTESEASDAAAMVLEAGAASDDVRDRRGVGMIALCESGHAIASGQRCPNAAELLIEVMPAQHRASHVTAGSRGSYPQNGALRLLVCEGCAERP